MLSLSHNARRLLLRVHEGLQDGQDALEDVLSLLVDDAMHANAGVHVHVEAPWVTYLCAACMVDNLTTTATDVDGSSISAVHATATRIATAQVALCAQLGVLLRVAPLADGGAVHAQARQRGACAI